MYRTLLASHVNDACKLVTVASDADKKMMSDIDLIISVAPPIDRDCILYRGISDTCQLRFDPNQYISTTLFQQIAESFSYNGLLLKVHVKKGTRCILMTQLSRFPKEAEILFPRNLRFHLLDSTMPKSGIVNVELR